MFIVYLEVCFTGWFYAVGTYYANFESQSLPVISVLVQFTRQAGRVITYGEVTYIGHGAGKKTTRSPPHKH